MDPAAPPARWLVVKLSSLGDVLHALPAVHLLQQAGHLEIDWVTQPEYVELVRCFTPVARVIAFPRRGSLRDLRAFRRVLRQTRYDRVLDFQGLLKSAWVAWTARAALRVGPAWAREGSRWCYHQRVGDAHHRRHAIDEALAFARALVDQDAPVAFPMRLPPAPDLGAGRHFGLAPCSRWPTKNWPSEHFVTLGRALQATYGATLHLVGGPADHAACATLEAALRPAVVNWCGRTSLPELAALLSALERLIAVDTGPMHLAAAVGTPVTALFGATDPARTGPYGPVHQVITRPDLPCRPCHARRCRLGTIACLRDLDPATVLETLKSRHGAN